MKPIVMTNSKIPKLTSFFINVSAITIFPFIFIKDKGNIITLNHEKIHWAQQKELLIIGFYLLYVINWLFNLIRCRDFYIAYRSIIFEREAYKKEVYIDYLENRKNYAWVKYAFTNHAKKDLLMQSYIKNKQRRYENNTNKK